MMMLIQNETPLITLTHTHIYIYIHIHIEKEAAVDRSPSHSLTHSLAQCVPSRSTLALLIIFIIEWGS